MAFFAVDKAPQAGTLYLMWFKIREAEELVWKIGVTSHEEPIDRMLQILRSFYMNKNHRYVPESYVKRFRKTENVFGKEAMMLQHFSPYRWYPASKFDGHTEMITGVDEEVLLDTYEQCLAGIDINKKEEDGCE